MGRDTTRRPGYLAAWARWAFHGTRGFVRRPVAGGRRSDVYVATFPGLLQDLGPAFAKLGQLAATRQDLLSPRLCAALATLHDDARPLAPEEVSAAVARLGDRLAPDPPVRVGTGTIAGVYRARTADGRDVALKIRRAAVAERMRRDVTAVRRAVALVAPLPVARRVPLLDMLDYLSQAVADQTDLRRELANLERLRADLAPVDVRLPEPAAGWSDDDVLVMEYLPAFASGDGPPPGPAQARRMLDAVFTMLFRTGFVHLDLHAGNLAWDGEGRLQLVDAGFAVHVPPQVRREFCEFFLGLSTGNGARAAASILRSAVTRPASLDVAAFTADVERLVGEHTGLPAREFSVVRFVGRLFGLQRRHGIFVSSAFAAPILTLVAVEGSIRAWDPDVDFQRVAQPQVVSALARFVLEERAAVTPTPAAPAPAAPHRSTAR